MKLLIWFTGLSGAGKTTLAGKLKDLLQAGGESVQLVDGDPFREKTRNSNTFTREEIIQNNLRMIRHCEEIAPESDYLLVSAISPYQETRDIARRTFGRRYLEVFVDCPVNVLSARDTKGLYARAARREITNLIGVSASTPYERPAQPDLVVDSSLESPDESLARIRALISKHGATP